MSKQKKHVLLVDDDPALLNHLVVSLSAYRSLELETATDGAEAVEKLDKRAFDLVVTDLKMPRLDGFQLVSHINRRFPKVPVIIISGHVSSDMTEMLGQMGIVSFERKPIDVDALANQIFDLLVGVDSGYVHGISIPSFLQVLQADRKTCSLKVTDGIKTGFLHLDSGTLVDAELDGLRGEDAAMAIISWDRPLTIDIQDIPRTRGITIRRDATHLIMEALRRKDEASTHGPDEAATRRDSLILPDRISIPPASHAPPSLACTNPGAAVPQQISDAERQRYGQTLKNLFDVKGYRASAVLSHDGRALATHAVSPETEMQFVARTANDMFSGLQAKAALIGMSRLEESVFRSPDGILLMRCCADPENYHIHLMAISDHAEGEGLMRIRLKRSAEAATARVPETEEPSDERDSSPLLKGTF